MDFEKLTPVVIPALFLGFIFIEWLRPARALPREPWWRLRGVLAFAVTGAFSAGMPLIYADLLRSHRVLQLERIGPVGATALAVLAGELVGYWWHRFRHTRWLWRAAHQMHHSAERIDVFGLAYFHPLDIVLSNLVAGLVLTGVLGLGGQAAAFAGLFTVLCGIFQHANIETPRWLGYLVQRPESHSVHHARGRHTQNYANLPILDILFGTFANPHSFEAEAGFYPGSSLRIADMLIGRDVSAPRRRAA